MNHTSGHPAEPDPPMPTVNDDTWLEKLEHRLAIWSHAFNPFLVKETGRIVGNRIFIFVFLATLVASLTWTFVGAPIAGHPVMNEKDAHTYFSGFLIIIAIPLLVILPITVSGSMQKERLRGTHPSLRDNDRTAGQYVLGKLTGGAIQLAAYCSVVVPSLVLNYSLGGIQLSVIAQSMAYLIAVFMALCLICILISSLHNLPALFYVSLAMSAGLGISTYIAFLMVVRQFMQFFDYGGTRFSPDREFHLLFAVVYSAGMYLAFAITRAQLGVGEMKRLCSVRFAIIAFQLAVIFSVVYHLENSNAQRAGGEIDFVTGVKVLQISGFFWFFAGAFLVAERAPTSAPTGHTFTSVPLVRIALAWFQPGPGRGLVFCLASYAALLFSAATWYYLHGLLSGRMLTFTSLAYLLTVGTMILGYLSLYLGTARLLLLAIRRRRPISVPVGGLLMIVTMAAVNFGPLVIDVYFGAAYPEVIKSISWLSYTMHEIKLDGSNLIQFSVGDWLLLLFGGVMFVLNVPQIRRELDQSAREAPRQISETSRTIAAPTTAQITAPTAKPTVHPLD